jgi:two-component system, sensor histidine kinase PdtaS
MNSLKLYILIGLSITLTCHLHSQNDTTVIKQLTEKIVAFDKVHQEDSVLVYAKKCLDISQKTNDASTMASALGRIGVVYMHKGNYPNALTNFFKALPIYEKLQDKTGVLIQYGNIGIVYDNQNDNTKALDYYFKALKIAESINDKQHESIQYCNIAIVYSKENDLEKTKTYFLKALAIDKLLNDKEGIARNLINVGSTSNEQKKYDEALKYFSEGLILSKEIGENYQIAACLANMADTHVSLQQYKKAEPLFLQSLTVAELTSDLDLRSQIELMVSEFYTTIKKDNPAFEHYKQYIALRDSVYNKENTKKSVELEMNYKFDKKEAASKLESAKAVNALETKNKLQTQKQLFLISGFVVFAALMIVLLFFAKRAYNTKKKYSEILATENETKELLMQEVHHRINNSLQMISSLLSIQADTAINKETQDYLIKTETRIHAMSAMHQLLQETNTSLEVDIHSYLLKVIDFYKHVLETKPNIQLEVELPSIHFLSKTALPLALIVNELITNAIKYAFPNEKGCMKISLLKTPTTLHSWQLIISDNGIGLPTSKTPLKESSLGLELVSIMSKQIGGVLTISNVNGTSFEIKFEALAE